MRCPKLCIHFYFYQKNASKSHAVRSGKETSFMLAGQSLNLSGNRAMRSFLEALRLWKHSENLLPKKHPHTIFVLSSGAKASKKFTSSDPHHDISKQPR